MRILKMLSGAAAAIRRVRRSVGWGGVTDDGINDAVRALMERRFGWYVEYGGTSGWLYYKQHHPVGASADGFRPVWYWDYALKAARECAEGGVKVRFEFRRGTDPRHLCEALLKASGVAPGSPERLNEISSGPAPFHGFDEVNRKRLSEMAGVLKGL
jgi:hypothetical protein